MGVNPTKRTHFQVIEDGLLALDPAAIAAVQIPGVTLETAEHVEANHIVKTPTLIRVEDFEIKLYEDRAQQNNFWLTHIPYDQDTGAFLDDVDGEFDFTIEQLKPDLETVIRRFEVKGCRAIASSFEESERTSTDNQIRTITLSPKRMIEEAA